MFDTIGSAFFDALRRAAERHLEPGHPCIEALGTAARGADSGADSTAIAAAQDALAALDPATMNALMAEAQRLLREDPARILGGWNPTGVSH